MANILREQGKIAEADKMIAEAREMDEDMHLINATRESGIVFMPMFFQYWRPIWPP